MRQSLSRFSVSIPTGLLAQLDTMARARGFANRSKAIAYMVRSQLVEHHAQIGRKEIAGTITLVYDHHRRGLQTSLTKAQHTHQNLILSVLHIHLDHCNCMEVLAVRGRAGAVKALADRLISARGIKHGRLTVTTTGKEFA